MPTPSQGCSLNIRPAACQCASRSVMAQLAGVGSMYVTSPSVKYWVKSVSRVTSVAGAYWSAPLSPSEANHDQGGGDAEPAAA